MANITGNRFYNDEGLGQAFNNLAAAFQPPGAGEIAAYATAADTKQKTMHLAQLFTSGKSPSEQAALIGVQGYGQTPQGFTYQVDQGSATQRYGYDTTAETAITNNQADNARALATNEADNNRAVVQTAFGPLNQGQIRPEIPAGIESQFGLPALPQVAGEAKPLSETELKAAIMADLPIADQQAAVLSDIPVENIIMGDKPTVVRRSDAVGKAPYFNPNAGATVQMPAGETAYDREVGTGLGKQYLAMQEAATTARSSLDALTIMEQAASDPNFYSGAGGEQVLQFKRAITAMGGDPEAVTSTETFNAAASQAALANMGGSLGAGFSNADRDFVMRQVPNLGNTPAGNKALISIHRRLAQRKLEIAEQAEVYAQKHNGRLDAGFNGYISQWAEQNPLFPAEIQGQPTAPSPGAAPETPQYATNPETGERLKLENGQWVPVQ